MLEELLQPLFLQANKERLDDDWNSYIDDWADNEYLFQNSLTFIRVSMLLIPSFVNYHRAHLASLLVFPWLLGNVLFLILLSLVIHQGICLLARYQPKMKPATSQRFFVLCKRMFCMSVIYRVDFVVRILLFGRSYWPRIKKIYMLVKRSQLR